MKKVLPVFLALMVLVTGLAFAKGSQDEAAAEELNTTLRLLTWGGYAPDELLTKFKEETGINVEVIKSNNEEMISKLRATRGGGFDLAQPSQDRISSVQAEFKIYQPIDWSQVNTDQLDPSLVSAVKKNTMVDGETYGVPHVYGTSGLIVNKKLAPDVKDYKDLLDPQYTGRVSYRMKRPTLIAMGYSLGHDPFELYSDLGKYQAFLDEVGDALISAKPVVRNYYDNGDQLMASMLAEEVWAAMAWEQVGWKMHDENPDIDYIAPESGPLAWVDTFAIPAKSENVKGAYLWINFILRPENAAVFTNAEKYGTASKDAGKFLNADIADNFARGLPPEALANTNWYPTVPAGLEEMEGKVMDKIRASN